MATTACLPMHSHSPSILQHSAFAHRPPRRIRFAPLPDPRRSVLVTDAGDELPLSPASFFPAVPTPSPTPANRSDYFAGFDAASSCSSSSDSKLNSDSQELSSSSSSASSISAAPSPPISTPSESSPTDSSPPPLPYASPSKKSWFFRSLKRSSWTSPSSSSNTLTPVASVDRTPNASTTFPRRNISAEEILTLGTINLFRPSSKDTYDAEAPPSAWSLTRWSSAGSPRDPYNGSPLYRVSSAQSTRSTQSYQSNSTLKPKIKMPKRPSKLGPPNRKGTRMLNGRVYGGKQNENPFANARDEEPTFVEWGYGGMGSVRGATSAGAHGRWERLQDSQQDEDDGSGLAWVRKRKEQRERENKERDQSEKQSRTDAVTVTQSGASVPSPSSPPSGDAPAATLQPADDEHVMTAVNIPAPHRYIRHCHSRSTSKDGVIDCHSREAKVTENESDGSRSSTSDSDSDEEHEDDSSSSGEDEDEDEEEERKTVLGAGVEKISRHH